MRENTSGAPNGMAAAAEKRLERARRRARMLGKAPLEGA